MVDREYMSQFENLMQHQKNIGRHLRAAVIDWMFECATKLGIEDKSVVFEAVTLMDRFYQSTTI